MTRKPTNRSRGEGSIYRSDYMQLKSGVTVERWVAQIELDRNEGGQRRRRKITGPTREAVADQLRELQRQRDAGVDLRK